MAENNYTMTSLERANAALIQYPRFRELHEEIRLCQRVSRIAGEPQCMSLQGRTGAGKTTLVRAYADSFPVVESEDGRRIPVFYMGLPSPVGIKDVASAALKRIGDPAYKKGTRASLTMRLVGLIKDCGIELVILDEFQHLIDSETNHILAQVSDWLKSLIKETGVSFLVVGIEGKVEVILDANPQLSRLFASRECLNPFAWEPARPESIQEFARFVEYAEKAVEKPLSRETTRTEMLYRIHYATDGVVGNVMNLIRFAMMLAGQRGSSDIDLAMLSLAFQKRLAKHLKGKIDPFSAPADDRFTPPVSPPDKPEKPRGKGPTIRETLKAR
jgi:energy-coupling factor transporter ATP-binding protein EcfA2